MWNAIVFIVSVPIAGLLIWLAMPFFAPKITGRRRLLLEARKLGVDTSSIPDAAWDELVTRCIEVSKSTLPVNQRWLYWRENLDEYLTAEAAKVALVLDGVGGQTLASTRATFLAHGVSVPIQ